MPEENTTKQPQKAGNTQREIDDGLVSVIMPSWNTAKFIGESIESVLRQTYKNLGLTIVDNRSRKTCSLSNCI